MESNGPMAMVRAVGRKLLGVSQKIKEAETTRRKEVAFGFR